MIGMEANKIAITDEALRRGAEEGMDGFLKVFIDKYLEVYLPLAVITLCAFTIVADISNDKKRNTQIPLLQIAFISIIFFDYSY